MSRNEGWICRFVEGWSSSEDYRSGLKVVPLIITYYLHILAQRSMEVATGIVTAERGYRYRRQYLLDVCMHNRMGSSSKRRPRKSGGRSSSKRSSSTVSDYNTNGHLLFFVFSALVFIAAMTNFVLHSYLPGEVFASSEGDNGGNEEAYDAEVQAGLRGGGGGAAVHINNGGGVRSNHNAGGRAADVEAAAADERQMNRDLRPNDHAAAANANDNDNHNNSNDQNEILRVLQQAGVTVDDATLATLPKWSDITSMYGPEPIIYGLDTCTQFQAMQDPADAFIGPAGIFNTGTNLLAELLKANCVIPAKRKRGRGPGMRWQVPWGKHNPVKTFRLHNVAGAEKEIIDQTAVLPVVTTKDPYGWFGSMCRHPYAAKWSHRGHCPNLALDDKEKRMGGRDNGVDGGVPVSVAFGPMQQNVTHHDSLAGLWNDWYGDYYDITDYPRLIVRFEDIMISPKEVVTKVCECGGGKLKDANNFVMVADSAKGSVGAHKGASGLVSALTRYGDPKKRTQGLTEADLDYAREHLRSDLMEAFGYAHPPKI